MLGPADTGKNQRGRRPLAPDGGDFVHGIVAIPIERGDVNSAAKTGVDPSLSHAVGEVLAA